MGSSIFAVMIWLKFDSTTRAYVVITIYYICVVSLQVKIYHLFITILLALANIWACVSVIFSPRIKISNDILSLEIKTIFSTSIFISNPLFLVLFKSILIFLLLVYYLSVFYFQNTVAGGKYFQMRIKTFLFVFPLVVI